MKAWQNNLKDQMDRAIIKRTIRNLNSQEKVFAEQRAMYTHFSKLGLSWPNIKWSNECRMTRIQTKAIEAMLNNGSNLCCAVINKSNQGTAILLKDGIQYVLVYEDGKTTVGRIPKFLPDDQWFVSLNKGKAPTKSKLKSYCVKRYS
jgi:hypothetical protein